jgi:excisionase family DNA binding protein
MDIYYTIEEVAEKFKVTSNNIRLLIRNGKIKAVRFGKLYRIKESDLKEFLVIK